MNIDIETDEGEPEVWHVMAIIAPFPYNVSAVLAMEYQKDKIMDQLEGMLDFQMTVANFYYFVGLAYAEPSVIAANMQPLRGTITTAVDKGCGHRIPGIKKMYISVKPQIAGFFELLDHYIAGEVSRDKVIEVSEGLKSVNLKKPVNVSTSSNQRALSK
jgi:hypothetical protein